MDNDVITFVQVMMVIVATVAALAGIGLGSWFIWRKGAQIQPGMAPRVDDGRMERLESAVDAIAIEVERISEGQRFTTRLLAERGAERAPERGQSARVPELTSPQPGGRHAQ